MAIDLKLATVITTAFVDSINPCAIGVLILLISTLLALTHNKRKMLFVGSLYTLVVYITYFLMGLGLLYFMQLLGSFALNGITVADLIAILVAIVIILGGLVEIKDFFWYGKGFSLTIPLKQAKKIHDYAKKFSIPGIIFLGMFVAAVELPCTGGPYLAITSILAKSFDLKAVYYLLIYNFIFVLPLLVIVLLAYFGVKIVKIKDWKEKEKRWMRLGIGLLMVGLGILLILYSLKIISL